MYITLRNYNMQSRSSCINDRCMCGCCKVMPTQRESICCKETEQLKCLVEDPCLEVQPTCITQHADFNHVCLCRTVLAVSLYAHLHRYEGVEVPDDEKKFVSTFYWLCLS